MKTIIFLSGFNNYYNHKVKGPFADVSEYIDNYSSVIRQRVNFNCNDGVKTSLTVNMKEEESGCDYVLVIDENDPNYTIESRWFIIDERRNLNGQYTVFLKRDSVADHLNEIKDAPVFVQKAMLDYSNPLIFNSEGLNFNQIKQKELLLKDETNINWIVGYIANDAITEDTRITSVSGTIPYPILESLSINLNDSTEPLLGGKINYITKTEFMAGAYNKWARVGGVSGDYDINDIDLVAEYKNNEWGSGWYNVGPYRKTTWSAITWKYSFGGVPVPREEIVNLWGESVKLNKTPILLGLEEHLKGVNRSSVSYDEYKRVADLDGQIVYSSSTDKYYRVSLGASRSNNYLDLLSNEASYSYDYKLFYALDNAASYVVKNANPEYKFIKVDPRPGSYAISYDSTEIEIFLTEVDAPGQYSVTLTADHYQLTDSPYSMFALEYSKENLDLAQSIAKKFSTSVYDVQIVPYFPCRYLLDPITNQIIVNETDEGRAYNKINNADDVFSEKYLYWAQNSDANFIIYQPIALVSTDDPIELKVENECNMYRLVSPNYNGAFEFSIAKNNGVDYFEVNFTYKPYSPFIHVAPNFKGLYGSDFNDSRGLVCNGNFSVSSVSEAWANYELQNKNFQNIFNTQIKTMDENNKLQRISNAVSMPLNAASQGVTVGLLGGGIAGGVAAGVGSLAAGIGDIAISESMYQNNRQAQIDLFNYNLQNIKARPDTLSNVTAFNVINKYFPFVEIYSCTEEEKNALRNKIKYEGMTVMTIGKISDYISNGVNYFKGQLIQSGDIIQEDYHIVDAIATELERGVYL